MNQPSLKKLLGAGAALMGVITPPMAQAVDPYSIQFATQVSAPRPVMTAEPAAYLFSDVEFAEERPVVSEERRTTVTRTRTRTRETAGEVDYASSGKSGKQVIPPEDTFITPPTGPTFSFTGGYSSRYWYKGLDQIEAASGGDTSGILYGRFAMEWEGFAAYAGYVHGLDRVEPRYNNIGETVHYGETQLGLSYTVGLIEDLDLTVGYNAIFFNDRSYFGHNYQGEAFAKLAYNRFRFLVPSISAAYMHADDGAASSIWGGPTPLDGWWYEARLDSYFTLFERGDFSISINPFVVLGIEGGYNTGGTESFDPYTVEYGLNMPVRLKKNITLTLHVNGASPIESEPMGSLSIPDFWAGASLTIAF